MSNHIYKAILGGAAGTAVMTAMMYFVAPMMLGRPMDIAGMLAPMLGGSWALGMIAHLFLGIVVFPLTYAYVYPWLMGSPMVRGVIAGVALWLVAQVVVMPAMGAGLFSANAGGMMAAMASLMGHLVYGALLGGIAGPQGQPSPVRAVA